ncbi:MAG TPA: hypothetical protein P5287_08440 [bacterium]|nr:hypothetical protein [bacterium]
MRQYAAAVALILVCVCAGVAKGEESPKDVSPSVPAAQKAAVPAKKRSVDDKTLIEIKKQLRDMRAEMAELEEKLDRATTVGQENKRRK